MNILPIKQYMPAVQFRGIIVNEGSEKFGDVHYDNGLEAEMGTEITYNRKSLYPFIDDTEAEIHKSVKKYTKNKEWTRGLVNCIEKTIVEIKKALPFTKAEYAEFIKQNPMKNEELIKFIRIIELVTKK